MLEKRIQAFANLGKFLKQFSKVNFIKEKKVLFNDLFFEDFAQKIKKTSQENAWFTKENICKMLLYWSENLKEKTLQKWLLNYKIPENNIPKKIAIIMAGNIPLVGFHDFLCVLILGNEVQIKLSEKDKNLLPLIAKYLMKIHPEFEHKIHFTKEKLKSFQAILATGSNNTSNYFQAYFGKYPHIIRKHKNSIAILDGKEKKEDLQGLAEDIFSFFGLGCRSVSKIFVPKNYDFHGFFEVLESYKFLAQNTKYKNNYDYNKAVYLMNVFEFKDNGFFILKEDENYCSPIACLFFEYYENPEKLAEKIKLNSEKIQCIVTNLKWKYAIKIGQAQKPHLSEYADGKDTLHFILNL